MASDKFRCPYCKRSLTKSPMAHILGGGGAFIGLGGMPPTISCPECGGAISTQAMIDGKYDEKGTPALVQLMFMGIWIGGWLFLWQGQGWNGWASFGLSTLVLLIVGALVGKLTGNR